MVSSRLLLSWLSKRGIEGFSGEFVWFDPMNTAFSLDGVHPSSAGYGIVANAIIAMMNALEPMADIPYVDLEPLRGQYLR